MLIGVQESILSAAALAELVLKGYELGPVERCDLFAAGVNDTYKAEIGGATYWLRVYREGWRRRCDVEAEVQLLESLGTAGFPAGLPLKNAAGVSIHDIEAPEGPRYAVLFTDASGSWYDKAKEDQPRLFGAMAGRLHNLADGIALPSERLHIDLKHLLDDPIERVSAYYSHRPDVGELATIGSALRKHAALRITPELDFGICHGDLHWGNVRFDAEGKPRLFDFDCFGYGWRAYDVCVFWWNMNVGHDESADRYWEAFREGYASERRALSEAELAAAELFVAIRQVWLIDLNCQIARHVGRAAIGTEYWDYHFGFLKEWVASHGLAEPTAQPAA